MQFYFIFYTHSIELQSQGIYPEVFAGIPYEAGIEEERKEFISAGNPGAVQLDQVTGRSLKQTNTGCDHR